MSTIPMLTEQKIRTFVGEQNFLKGQQGEKLDETEQWTTYIAWLRKRHSRLSTLKEELAAAGL